MNAGMDSDEVFQTGIQVVAAYQPFNIAVGGIYKIQTIREAHFPSGSAVQIPAFALKLLLYYSTMCQRFQGFSEKIYTNVTLYNLQIIALLIFYKKIAGIIPGENKIEMCRYNSDIVDSSSTI